MLHSAAIGCCLAQSPLSGVLTMGLWVMMAAVLALAGTFAVLRIKRWTRRDEEPEAFTLQNLREMKAKGEISESEFSRLRGVLLARTDLAARTADAGGEGHTPGEGEPRESDDARQ